MKFNYRKLLGKITEEVKTQSSFAKKMGLSEKAISFKLNGKVMFRQNEILNACEILNIPKEDIATYFFDREVQTIEQN